MSEVARLQAYRNTLRVCLLVFGIAVISIPLDIGRYGFWELGAATIAHAIEAVVIAVVLWRWRDRWSVRACDLAYALLFAPYLFTIWVPQIYEHRDGTLVEPLLAHHFLMLGIAIVPPYAGRWAVALVGVFAAHGVALWAVLEGHAVSPTLEREPWFTLLFAAIALGILWSRWRRRDLALRLASVEARADAVERLNRVLLALRDRANTPLQTLEVALAVLEQRSTTADPALASMRRAIAKLIEAQQPLARVTSASSTAQLSIDLEHELRELRELPR